MERNLIIGRPITRKQKIACIGIEEIYTEEQDVCGEVERSLACLSPFSLPRWREASPNVPSQRGYCITEKSQAKYALSKLHSPLQSLCSVSFNSCSSSCSSSSSRPSLTDSSTSRRRTTPIAALRPVYTQHPPIMVAVQEPFKPAIIVVDMQEDFCPPVSTRHDPR